MSSHGGPWSCLLSLAVHCSAACGQEPKREKAPRPRRRRADRRGERRRRCRRARSSSARSSPASCAPTREATVRAELGGSMLEVDGRGRPGRHAGRAARPHRDPHAGGRAAVGASRRCARPENQLAVARREVERTEKLVKAGALAARELDVARNTVVRGRGAARRRASRGWPAPNAQLGDTVIRAPFTGIVSKPHRERAATSSAPAPSSSPSSTPRPCGSRRRCRRKTCRSCASAPRSTSRCAATTSRSRGASSASPAGRPGDAAGADLRGDSQRRRPAGGGPVCRRAGRAAVGERAGRADQRRQHHRARRRGCCASRRQDRARRRDARPARPADRARADRVGADRRRRAAARRGAGHHAGHAGEGRAAAQSECRATDMFISDFAIKRPILTVVAMLALVVFGIVALVQLDTDEFPEIDAADRRRSRFRTRAPRRTSSSARSSIRSRR